MNEVHAMFRSRTAPDAQPAATDLLHALPFAAMTCRADDLVIDDVNQASLTQLQPIRHLLPCDIEALVGQSIDVLHQTPERARAVLQDPSRLPHTADIKLGDQVLELRVSAVRRDDGTLSRFLLLWRVVTAERERERHVERLMAMLDTTDLNVMLVDKASLEITYANAASIKTLTPIAHLLPCAPSDIVGQNLDIFHKHPERARAVLSDPARLPHRAVISLGDEWMELHVCAIHDRTGAYVGPMLNWSLITDQEMLRRELTTLLGETRERSSSVAAGAEELAATAHEIGQQCQRTSEVARDMADRVALSQERIDALAAASDQIGNVAGLISGIADQTKLLALNATIEAARAGDAGRGFAVVASEVKALATATGNATGDIARQIEAIAQSVTGVAEAIGTIRSGTDQLSEMTTTVAAAVEEQTAATRDMSSNVVGVSSAADEMERLSERVLNRAN